MTIFMLTLISYAHYNVVYVVVVIASAYFKEMYVIS